MVLADFYAGEEDEGFVEGGAELVDLWDWIFEFVSHGAVDDHG